MLQRGMLAGNDRGWHGLAASSRSSWLLGSQQAKNDSIDVEIALGIPSTFEVQLCNLITCHRIIVEEPKANPLELFRLPLPKSRIRHNS
jgi:hypothetical protein